MNEQPEALRHAEWLELSLAIGAQEAAAELRRLHDLCAEWEKKAETWLATPEAAKRLDGYRELFQRVDTLEYALRQALEALERGETQLRYQAIAIVKQVQVDMRQHAEGNLGIGCGEVKMDGVKWDASAPLTMTPHPEFKKAQKLYYTVLTSGEGEQYAIIGLYASEQPVDTQEWSDALKAYNSRLEAEHRAIYVRHGGRLGYGHIPAAHAEYIAYMQSTHPLQAFLAKHHMQKLDFKEIWTWGQP